MPWMSLGCNNRIFTVAEGAGSLLPAPFLYKLKGYVLEKEGGGLL